MILIKPTQAEAQELADRCHAHLINKDTAYASSVAAGQTLRWATPTEQFAESGMGEPPGQSLGWGVPVEPRVSGALTEAERALADL